MVRIQRTALGPRLFVLGRRIHEYQLGALLLVGLVVGDAIGRVEVTSLHAVLLLTALWLVAKDWRDIFPRLRDTTMWRLGMHRRPTPLRPARTTEFVPRLAAFAAAGLAVVNLVSALTPNAGLRGHLLLQLENAATVHLFHAVAVPVSLTLLAVAHYLARRRRSAWRLALGLLLGLVALDLAKGLDVEEALLTLGGAWLLWWGKDEFTLGADHLQTRTALRRSAVLALGTVAVAGTIVRLGALHASWLDVARETGWALVWQKGPIAFTGDMSHIPLALGLLGATSLLACLSVVLRPLAAPIRSHGAPVGEAVGRIVRTHGRDTLDFFKLRRDLHHVFDPTGRAFVSYRIESGVLVCSGDPVGPPDAIPGAVAEVVRLAERHGLRLGAIGVSETASKLYGLAGLRRLYLGDEAIVETATFSLEGREIRKVRQSVNRLEREGYTFELVEHRRLTATDLADCEAVTAAWLDGAEEKGFSMALDSLHGAHLSDTLLELARDSDGRIRGFLHFVPARGRRAVSLSTMRRDASTPNGLTEALVARAIEALRERGVEDVSLNFAVFARFMHEPTNPAERAAGRAAAVASSFFQLESLYRFNAKFFPRWEPRYLVYEKLSSLPRIGLAAAWVEGQLPKPPSPRVALARRPLLDRAA